MYKNLLVISFLILLSNNLYSQQVKSGDNFQLGNNQNLSIINKISQLSYEHFSSQIVSTSLKNFNSNNSFNRSNFLNHQSLIFAKINFFSINNLKRSSVPISDNEPENGKEEDSFWDNNFVYFAIGAAVAVILYLVWQSSGSDDAPQNTLGLPPKP